MALNQEPIPAREEPRQVRIGTIVWGLVVAAVGTLVLLAQLTGFSFDLGQVFIGLLVGAGLALVIGGLASAFRRSPRQ